MGLVALSASALRLRNAMDANDFAVAQVLAKSAVEYGIQQVHGDNSWRTTFVHDIESQPMTLGQGTIAWKLVDDDGNLADDDSDSVRVVGIGRVGTVTVAESVRLLASGEPLACLGSAFTCAGDINVKSAVQLMTNQQISSGGNISTGFLSSIQGNVEAAGTASGSIQGNIAQNVPARRMPGSSAFDYYLDNGTHIPLEAIPNVSGILLIDRQVLSPQVNPYGELNREGIYIINCAGQQICIKNSRILGTLVLLNPASNSALEGALRWDAAVANYPALLVQGSLQIKFVASALSESSLSTNFNPSSVPYGEQADSDLLGTYPSEINGLVYFSGQLDAPQDHIESPFRGVTVCQSINASSSARFNYRPLLFEFPAPGFSSGNPMVICPRSRRRETVANTMDPNAAL
ncbi:MAG: hypothetical protein R3C53_08830 [Pirellulaceae bacterium]